jgi:hypothetical protein
LRARRRSLVLSAALVVSVSLNVWILVLYVQSTEEASAPKSAQQLQPITEPVNAGNSVPDAFSSETQDAIQSSSRENSDPGCDDQLADLTRELRSTEASLFDHLPANVRFDKNPRIPAPPDVKRHIARILGGPGFEKLTHRLECRGDLCWLELVKPRQADVGDYWDQLHLDEELGKWVDKYEFELDPPNGAPARDATMRVDNTYLTLAKKNRERETALLEACFDQLYRSGSVAECAAGADASGVVDIMLILDGSLKTIRIHESGSLAADPVADCIVSRLRSIVASTEVPSDAVSAWWRGTIRLPY